MLPEPEVTTDGGRRDLAGMLLPDDNVGAMSLVRAGIEQYSCPFAWMLKSDLQPIF